MKKTNNSSQVNLADVHKVSDRKYWILLIATGVLSFGLILFLMLSGISNEFDNAIQRMVIEIRNEPLNIFMSKFTLLGNWQTIVGLCIVLLIIKPTRVVYGIPLSAGSIFVTALNKIIKTLVARPRPDEIIHLVDAHGFSFTSGHSITSMFFFGMAIWLVRKNIKSYLFKNVLTVLLIIPTVGIGLSRIYCGVHYPTDVLAGWALGLAAIGGAIGIIKETS